MSNFCKQCSIDVFGEDYEDMAGLSTEEDTAKGLYAWALCEDCGYIQVDHTGSCVTHNHRPQHGFTATGENPVI